MIKHYCMPVQGMNLAGITGTALYGMRINPYSKIYKKHNGVDINKLLSGAAIMGAPVVATNYGTVKISKMQSNGKGYGNYVVIIFDDGSGGTLDCHLQDRTVKAGDKVKPGDVIGHIGSTGDSTGPHLHHGVFTKFNATSISESDWTDPMPILKNIEEEDDMDETTVKKLISENAEGSRDTPSSWAKEAVPWAVKKGYLSDTKNLDGVITKEELATVLYRIMGGK